MLADGVMISDSLLSLTLSPLALAALAEAAQAGDQTPGMPVEVEP
jgi:hypothetical protein